MHLIISGHWQLSSKLNDLLRRDMHMAYERFASPLDVHPDTKPIGRHLPLTKCLEPGMTASALLGRDVHKLTHLAWRT